MPRTKKADAAPPLFRTANLNLAAYLVASQRLTLDRVAAKTKHSEFFFRDPSNQGASIAAEYVTKDLKVSAKLLLEARSSLLNEIRRGGGAV